MVNLEPILKYNMSVLEARAYKLSLLWIELVKQEFPNDKCSKLRKSGDPRKSILFRHCFKLAKETQGLIKPAEYKLYILAQLRSLAKMKVDDVHALIEPTILTGKNAWKRWKWWKWDYDKRMKQNIPDGSNNVMSSVLINQQLINTKNFLEKEGVVTKDLVHLMIDNGKFKEWFKLEKISPYYLMLSPFVKSYNKNLNEIFDKDFTIYKISEEIEQFFKEIFP
jgi:hypothetical protein